MTSLLDQFVAEECTPHVVGMLRLAARGGAGTRYLTFNRFNVRLNLDSGEVVIEDELDPTREHCLSIRSLLERLPA
jgi:hypothetical protein